MYLPAKLCFVSISTLATKVEKQQPEPVYYLESDRLTFTKVPYILTTKEGQTQILGSH